MADYSQGWQNGYDWEDPTQAGPSGIPDPNNPGYDTAGYPLDTAPTQKTEYPSGIPDDQSTWPAPPPQSPTAPPEDPGRVAHHGAGGGGQPGGAGETAPPPPTEPTGGGILAPFDEAAPVLKQQPAFSPLTFKSPSIQDAFDDSAWQWQRDQTLDGLNRWAAFKGTANDSGTGRAFLDLGNNIANQRLGDVWSRAYTQYSADEGAAERAYGMNRQSQYIDPYTALYNNWAQRGNWYYQNQGNATNALMSFASMQ
jgi:hypothetical protein